EIAALLDTAKFLQKARTIYGYAHFMADTGGSICEVVDPDDPRDPVLTALSDQLLLVQIRETEALEEELVRRFVKDPKPMYYPEGLLRSLWETYRTEGGVGEDAVDPDDFVAWGFRQLLSHRIPRYDAMARHWGVSVEAEEIAAVTTPESFDRLIATAIERRGAADRPVAAAKSAS
ncbi:MAG: ATPase, partial [Pseudomonadota bacterium]